MVDLSVIDLVDLIHPSLCVIRISPKIHIINLLQKRNSFVLIQDFVAKTTTSDEEDGDVDGGGTAEGNVRRGSKGGAGGAYVFREAAEA